MTGDRLFQRDHDGQERSLVRADPGHPYLATLCLALCTLWSVASTQLVHAAETARPSTGASLILDRGEALLASQRRDFVHAERALQRGDRHRYLRLLERLRDYPLYPYLLHADLKRRLAIADPGEVSTFIHEWRDTPLSHQLRVVWLDLLAKRGQWSEFVRHYRPVDQTRLQCLYLRALLETGQSDAALQRTPALWTVGKSQPKACDPVFDAWIRSGGVTRERAWQRVRLAMEAGQPRLARYLRRFLSEQDGPLLEAWLLVRARPEGVTRMVDLRADPEVVEDILVYGVLRLARRSPDAAAAAWSEIHSRFTFSEAARGEIHRRIALGYAYRHRPEAAQWFQRVSEQATTDRVEEWRILDGLRRADWPAVLAGVDRLAVDRRGEPRWEYWGARALAEVGMDQSADAAYRRIATGRGYYSFLAADNLDEPYRFSDRPLDFSDADLADLAERPAVRRARELFRMARRVQARREWRHLTRDLDGRDRARLAKLAANWGWHDQAILTLARTPYRDDLALRFPLAYHKEILRYASDRDIEPAWLFAVARQESAFMPDARSRVGALGLMQIMPETARVLMRSESRGTATREALLDAGTSLRLGSGYLRQLLDRLDQHPVLATAAYNAGKRRVERWRPTDSTLPGDIWIETVPFRETRDYLKRVFAYTAIYEWRLGREPKRLTERLARVRPRGHRLDARSHVQPLPTPTGG